MAKERVGKRKFTGKLYRRLLGGVVALLQFRVLPEGWRPAKAAEACMVALAAGLEFSRNRVSERKWFSRSCMFSRPCVLQILSALSCVHVLAFLRARVLFSQVFAVFVVFPLPQFHALTTCGVHVRCFAFLAEFVCLDVFVFSRFKHAFMRTCACKAVSASLSGA